jgi:carbon-monoxide dehydrogenase large subunit
MSSNEPTRRVTVTVNGEGYTRHVLVRRHLGDFLRQDLELTGTHLGCEHGVCGACTVLLDGAAVRSCLLLAVQADGRHVTTVEGLNSGHRELHPLQEAFRRRHALQCGFCTSGVLMSLAECFNERGPPLDEHEVRHQLSGNICRCTGYQGMVEVGLDLMSGRSAEAETKTGQRLVGQPVERVEDDRLLRGRGRYVDDIRLPRMLEAAFVRSSFAHARINHIDTASARAMPGVIAVWTLADLHAPFDTRRMPVTTPSPAILRYVTQFPLAHEEVCYVGEPIALVIAERRDLAEDAAAVVDIDYEPLPASSDAIAALKTGAAAAHADAKDNLGASLHSRYGDVDDAFARAAHVVRSSVRMHRGGCHSMECRGVIAEYETSTDRLTLWTSTQAPHIVRRLLCEYLGRDEHATRVVAPDVGGGFGPKAMFYPEEALASLAAMRLGRPIKWIEDRREHFLATTQQRDQSWDLEAALDADGRILGVRGTGVHDNGAYMPYGVVLPMSGLTLLPGPYMVPSFDVRLDVAYTNKVPTTPVRGAARPNAAFGMERLLDRAARQLGIDRLEIRRRNFVPPDCFPYKTGMLAPRDGRPMQYDSGNYAAGLDDAIQLADLPRLLEDQARARDQGRLFGIGIASYVEDTGLGPFEGVTIRVHPNGRVVAATGATSQGQGLHTIISQIVADRLSVGLEDIHVESADTAVFPRGFGAFASRVGVTAGASTHVAVETVRDKAFSVASVLLGVPVEELELTDGAVRVRNSSNRFLTLGAIAKALGGAPGISPPDGFEPGLEATSHFAVKSATYASGTHIAAVEIDKDTGMIALTGYWVSHDCGRMINPLIVEGQIIGGVVHGIGNALMEEMLYDADAQPLTTNYGDYLLPTASGLPRISISHVETPSPLNPLGAKGAGEGGIMPTAAAIVSAVEDALSPYGIEVSEHPIAPSYLAARIAERPELTRRGHKA